MKTPQKNDQPTTSYNHAATNVLDSTGVDSDALTKKAIEVFTQFDKDKEKTISRRVEKLENAFSPRELALITLGAYNGQRLLQELVEELQGKKEATDVECDCPICTMRREIEQREGKKIIFPDGPIGKA